MSHDHLRDLVLALEIGSNASSSSLSSSSSSSITASPSSYSSSSSSSSTTFLLALLDADAGFFAAAPTFRFTPLAAPLPPLPRPPPLAPLGFGVSSCSSSSSTTVPLTSSGLSDAPGWSSQSPSMSLSQLLGLGLNRFLLPFPFFNTPFENISSS